MASGQLNAIWTPSANESPVLVPALRASILVATTERTRPILAFPADADKEAVFSNQLVNYGGGGVTLRLTGAMSGTNTDTKVIRVEAAFERIVAGEVVTTSGFATAQVNESTVNNTANTVFVATVGFTHGAQMDSVADGEWFRIRVKRLNSGLTGTNASGIFNLLYAHLVEQ